MDNPLVSCVCCTYGRPVLLGEVIKCFIDQDYKNKELIVLNDQEGVILKLENAPDNVQIINYPTRFNSLGEKRNYLNSLVKGDYVCVWDDDDLYTPWRISESIRLFNDRKHIDIIKSQYALMSINNQNYKFVNNLFHSQACISRKYIDENRYPNKSVGEDIEFESNAHIESIKTNPFVFYIYRWGLNIHHLSGVSDEKESWDKSLHFESYTQIKGEVLISPVFQQDYWGDIEGFMSLKNPDFAQKWHSKINGKN